MSNRYYLNNVFFRRMLVGFASTVLLGSVLLPIPGSAGVFSWKDEKGNIHFTDALHKIPEKFRDEKKGFKKYKSSPPPSFLEKHNPSIGSAPSREVSRGLNGRNHIVPLRSTSGGNFLVEAKLNDRVKALLMVDTGASLVTLSSRLGRRLGLSFDEDSPQIPFATAGGTVWMPMVALDKVKVGNAEVNLVEASINDQMGELDGLLGMSFLGDFRMEVDRSRSRMILKPLGDPGDEAWNGKSGTWWKSRFQGYSSKIHQFQGEVVKLKIAGHPKSGHLEKMVGFYKDLHHKLDLSASRAGVPMMYRAYP